MVSVDRGLIDTLDISDPSEPRLIMRKLVLGYGGFPSSIDVENGVVAVALRGVIDTLPGKVLFFAAMRMTQACRPPFRNNCRTWSVVSLTVLSLPKVRS